MSAQPLRLAGLISGGGRTLLNIADAIDRGELNASIELVIASRESIAGVERLRSRGFDVQVINRRAFDSDDAHNDAVNDAIRAARIALVCLCGYLRHLRIDDDLRSRIINIHPALLPDFGGAGMFGDHVHRAVLEAGQSESGCTVHAVDEHYDHGPIIMQRRCPVLPDDDVESLAARVFAEECIAYPTAIRLIASGDVKLENDRVLLSPSARVQLASS